MKKKLLKTTFTEKLKKVTKFFNISKAYKSKAKFPSANRKYRCSENNRQVITGKETKLKTEKNEKLQKKLRKIVPIFAIFLSYFSTKNDSYPKNCNQLLS